jgi:glycerophosphoryl diester phosphodiesterase
LLTHKESIDLIKKLGGKYTPELKGPNRAANLQVEAVFGSQAAYAQAMIDDYRAAGISPRKVWAFFQQRRRVVRGQARAVIRQASSVSG